MTEENKKNFLDVDIFAYSKMIVRGEFGLPYTYWVLGVLGSIIWVFLFYMLKTDMWSAPNIDSDQPELSWIGISVISLLCIYYFMVYIGIWRAANRYAGNVIWRILAKFVVIINNLPILIYIVKYISGNS